MALGSATMYLLANVSHLTRGLGKANSEISFTVRNMGRIGGASKSFKKATQYAHVLLGVTRALGAAMAAGGLAAAAFGATAVKIFGKFDQKMHRVRAVTGATAEEFQRLIDLADEMAVSAGRSSTDIGGAMEFMGMAGFSPDEIEQSLQSVIHLAEIGGMEMAKAADIVTNISTGFGIAAGDMDKAAGVLTATMTTANTDLRQLGDAMKYVASVAKPMGLAIHEVSAVVGLLGNAGIQGEMAGAAIRNVLMRITKTGTKGKRMLAALGVELDAATIKSEGLVGVVKRLEESGAGAETIMRLAGARALPAMTRLMEEGHKRLKVYQEWLEKNAETIDVYNMMMDSYNAKMRRANSVVEVFTKVAGKELAAAMGVAAESFVTSSGGMDSLRKSIKETTREGIFLLLRSLADLLELAPSIASWVGTVADGLRLIRLLASTLANTFKVLVGTLTTGIGVIVKNLGKFGSWIQEKLDSLNPFMDESGKTAARALSDSFMEGMESSGQEMADKGVRIMKEALQGLDEDILPYDMLEVSKKLDKVAAKAARGAKPIRAFIKELKAEFKMMDEQFDDADSKMAKAMRRLKELLKAAPKGKGLGDKDPVLGSGSGSGSGSDKLDDWINKWGRLAKVYDKDLNPAVRSYLDYRTKVLNIGKELADEGITKQALAAGKLTEEQKEQFYYAREYAKVLKEQFNRQEWERVLAAQAQKLRNDRAATEAINQYVEGLKKARRLENEAMRADLKTGMGIAAGVRVGGNSAVLQQALEDANASAARKGASAQELMRMEAEKHNEALFRQVEAIDKLAQSYQGLATQEIPAMVEAMMTSEKPMVTFGNSMMAIGVQLPQLMADAATAFGANAEQAKKAQQAMNAVLALTYAAIGIATAVPNPAMAAGYLSAATLLGFNAMAQLNAKAKAADIKATQFEKPGTIGEDKGAELRNAIEDALKNAGLYQVGWDRLTIQTFGTTPVGFGSSDSRRQRRIEEDRQQTRRRRG